MPRCLLLGWVCTAECSSWRNKDRVPGSAGAQMSCVFAGCQVSDLQSFLVPIKCCNLLHPCPVFAAS